MLVDLIVPTVQTVEYKIIRYQWMNPLVVRNLKIWRFAEPGV